MRVFYLFVISSLFFIGFSTQIASAQTQTETFTVEYDWWGRATTDFTWTVPCGVTSINVQAWGSGAGGSGGTGGGGGGAFSATNNISVTPGTTYSIIVGVGASKGSGDDGEFSRFRLGNTNIVTAEGGGPGSGSRSGGRASNSIGAIKYSGGDGGASSSANGGAGGGGSAGASGPGGGGIPTNNSSGGNGGTGGAGGGARGGDGGSRYNDGNNGSSPGAGGGEKGGNGLFRYPSSGGGADGMVIITYEGLGNYCNPDFNYQVWPITNVTFAGINNSTSGTIDGTPALETFCNPQGNVTIGSIHNLSVKSYTGGNSFYYTAFIDWNQNGIFETSERYNVGNTTSAGGVNIDITIPSTAALGTTKMRVLNNFNSYPGDACGTYNYGQAEDYIITVSGNCQQPTGATGNGTATSVTICSGTQVVLKQTGGTLGPSQQWKWYLTPGGTPINTNTNVDAAYTISPSSSTTYYVRAEGGTCSTTGAYKSVTISVSTVGTLSVTSGSKDFSVCSGVNSGPYAEFTFGGGATGVTFAGLPSGMSASKLGNKYTISGSTTATGPFNYTATLTGNAPCANPEAITGTITINRAPATFEYTSKIVTYCTNALITPNVAKVTGGTPTTYTVIGTPLPTGLELDGSGNIIGTPVSAAAAANYTIRASNSCGYKETTVNITMSDGNLVFDITPNGTHNVCSNFGGIVIGLNGSQSGISYSLYRNGLAVGSPIVGTGSAINFGNQSTAGTYTVKATTGCATNMNGTTIINITQLPTSTFTYSSYTYCTQGVSGAANLTGSPLTGTFSASPAGLVFVDNTTGVIDLAASAPNSYSISYTIAASGGCGTYTYTNPTKITINTAPAVFTVFGTGSFCYGESGIPVFMDGSQIGVNYQLYLNGSPIGAPIAGTGAELSFINQTAAGTYTVKGNNGCVTDMDGSATITVNPKPAPVILTPASATVCQGTIVPLSASGGAPSPGTASASSGTISNSNNIPNNNPTGISSLLKVTGIPAGATITSVSINFRIVHPRDADLVINLKGPNGNVLNIANRIGGNNGANFGNRNNDNNNTKVSSLSTTPITTGTAPFNATTYSPQAAGAVAGATSVTNNTSNVTAFSGLYGATGASANGNWILSVRDDFNNNTGSFRNWEIVITYTTVNNPTPVTWSPVTDLFTDPGGITPYNSGEVASTVYAKPSAAGTVTYTATSTTQFGCSTSTSTTLTVNPSPVLIVSSDYCGNPGKVRIMATSNIPVSSWIWSTGEAGTSTSSIKNFIDVDVAGTYYVSAQSPGNGCSGTGVMSVAQELVNNGNFELGNEGFTSDYFYQEDDPNRNDELYNDKFPPNNGYGVGTKGQNYHTNFWGVDHTYGTGDGKFMIVNGHGDLVVWKNENVTVLPNTTYYFSGWGISLNSAGNYAQLKFNVEGDGYYDGNNVAYLGAGVENNSNNGWQKFYGKWTSGPTTTSVNISIINLRTDLSGNDFGLDDISFGTLSTFLNLTSDAGTDGQTACGDVSITPISYEAGGSGNDPIVTGLPSGLSQYWNGRDLVITGTPLEYGTFNYFIKVEVCDNKFLTKNGTLTVLEPVRAGSFTESVISACYGSNGTISLAANSVTGNIIKWQTSNDKINWTDISNKTPNQAYTNLQKVVYYRTVAQNGTGCKTAFSDEVKVGVRNLWTGEEDRNFTNIMNWSDERIPSVVGGSTCPTVVIPAVTNLPVLSSGNPAITHLQINANASLRITGTGSLGIAGTITNNGILDVTDGTIEFNGTAAQFLSGSILKDRTIKNLTVSNPAELRISTTPNDTLNITGTLAFGNSTAKLNTGDNITLKSTAQATANVGVVEISNTINGKFVVERFINTGTNENPGAHGKSWQLLATPTTGASIKESWQEGAISDGKLPMKNPTRWYGTLLTTGYKDVPANGFDVYTAPGPSIKTYQSETNSYDNGPLNTSLPLYNPKGYLVLVRGDRTVYTHNGAATPTVLRSKGKIITGTTVPVIVKKGTWESIGNPYPSQLDLRKLKRTGGVDDIIFVWDPKLGGAYGLGAFQTLTSDGTNYYATPGGGSYGSGPNNFIQSGQAFLVQASGNDGTVYFTENMKETGSLSLLRGGTGERRKVGYIRTSLNGMANGIPFLTDGNLVQFSEDFSNEIDGMDARKMTNTSENLGIHSRGVDLIVERRKNITEADTIFFKLSGVRVQAYQLEIEAANLNSPGLQAWLEDSYLQTRTPLDLEGTTTVDFTIANIPGSYASDRFRIVFRPAAPAAPLPVTFVSIDASRKNADILVEWKVETEINLAQYEVEKSQDGIYFTKAAVVLMDKNNQGKYQWLDQEPLAGYNYYRVRSIDIDGKTSISTIAKVMIDMPVGTITVYPNPITNGTVNLQLGNQPEGVYGLRLLNPVGQVLLSKTINHAGGNHTEKIHWDYKMARGMYQLEVTKPGGGVHLIKVVY